MIAGSHRLPAYGVFAAMLSAAGLPLYIHAPKFYVDEYGVSLAALGVVLFGLRLLDVVQDPLLGKLSAAMASHRSWAVLIGCGTLVAGMFGLFAIEPLFSPVVWFGFMLTLVFSAFSFLTICFYAQGVIKADMLGDNGHLRLARWRETGALLGVCVAAIAPMVLGALINAPFTGFALGFAVLGVCAALAMRGEWQTKHVIQESSGFRTVLQDSQARRLLVIAFVNAAPVAVSSTLFLFFVETRLQAPGAEGALLLLFFLSAALSAPFWGASAQRFGTKPVLLSAMGLAIMAFGLAVTLGAGDVWPFAVICVASGAAMGADLTLLPAIFARRMAVISPAASEGFGLWAFVSKFTLAFAAVLLLPALERAGLDSGTTNNPEAALTLLSLLYAGVPCALKLIAIGLLATTDLKED
ncbi:MAG: MFS transporter [Aliishimia sp.]